MSQRHKPAREEVIAIRNELEALDMGLVSELEAWDRRFDSMYYDDNHNQFF